MNVWELRQHIKGMPDDALVLLPKPASAYGPPGRCLLVRQVEKTNVYSVGGSAEYVQGRCRAYQGAAAEPAVILRA